MLSIAQAVDGPLSLTSLAMIIGMFGTGGTVIFFVGRSSGKIKAVDDKAVANTGAHKECQAARIVKEGEIFAAVGRLETAAARSEGKLDLLCKVLKPTNPPGAASGD